MGSLMSKRPRVHDLFLPFSVASSVGLALTACAAEQAGPLEQEPVAAAAATDFSAAACNVTPVTIAHTPGTPGQARFHKLSLAEHPRAVCNDGTPGFFIFRPGFGAGARRWHIFLEGGGSCGNDESCEQRWRTSRSLMTSEGLVDGAPYTRAFSGIKSADPVENPDLYDANLVQIHYCSSDQWTGDTAATPGLPVSDIDHWHFRGRAITAAVFEELATMGLAGAEEILMNGSSAGGMGVASSADDLRARLPAGMRMVSMQDAGFGLFYPPYDPVTRREATERPFPQELEFAAATEAWGGRGDLTCHLLAVDDFDRAECHIPSITFPAGQVTTPMFIRQSQLDAVQVDRLIDAADRSPPARAYRERFGAEMRRVLAGLPSHFGAFSTHDAEHGMASTTEGWTTRAVGGVILRDAFGAWYRDPCAPGGKHIEP
jgi:O-palmitoleoyl-L-serine hydrolase